MYNFSNDPFLGEIQMFPPSWFRGQFQCLRNIYVQNAPFYLFALEPTLIKGLKNAMAKVTRTEGSNLI